MELIQVDDVRKQIVELRKLVRVVDPGHHATLTNNTVREIDFSFSKDMEWIEADSNIGLSFATNMKKFKKLIKSKARFQSEVDIFVIDESMLIVEVHVSDLSDHLFRSYTIADSGLNRSAISLLSDRFQPNSGIVID